MHLATSCSRLATQALPPLDSRNRVLLQTERDLKVISKQKEDEKLAPEKKKLAMYGGIITTLAGLGLASYTHSEILFTADNLTVSLVTLGSGMLFFSLQGHDAVKKWFSKDADSDSETTSTFTFKLLNGKNMFSKELIDLESTCRATSSEWPAEVQSKLDTMIAEDVARLQKDILDQR